MNQRKARAADDARGPSAPAGSAADAALPAPRARTLLDPAQLSELASRSVQALLAEGASPNTQASYRAALRYWAAWFALRYGVQLRLPVPVAAVQQFLVDHLQRTEGARLVHDLPGAIDEELVTAGFKGKLGPLALSTVEHRLAVLSKAHHAHTAHRTANPVRDPKVRELVSRAKRAYAKRGARQDRKEALTKELLHALLATCDGSLLGIRDRALLLFAWASGGRRRSEVAQADMKFLQAQPDGSFVYELARSKGNQDGQVRPENFKPVAGAAAQALARWLQAAQITHGAIFRSLSNGARPRIGGPLGADQVRRIVQKRCKAAGLAGSYAAHSLRSGFVTEALRAGVTPLEAMRMTGHKDVRTLQRYHRASDSMSAPLRAVITA